MWEGIAIRAKRTTRISRKHNGVRYADHFLIVVVFWGFQFHLFDIWTTVLLGMSDYRHAWSDPQVFGFSYFDLNVALVALFLLYALGIGLCSLRDGRLPTIGRVWESLAFCMFVVGFSYRLFFLSQNALNDVWWEKATENEPWDRSGLHLGLILGDVTSEVASVLLESGEELTLRLPDAEPRYRVVQVHEYRTRYQQKVRYEVGTYVPYDDMELFLRNWTSFRNPR